MTLKEGSSLQGGKYRIEKVLGQGGFGITYLAKRDMFDDQVAIKEFFFKQYCERDEETSHVTFSTITNRNEVDRFQEKFIKEARIIARLNHPNIIKVHDIFNENNTAYYVMDYVEGKNLNDIVKQQGALSEEKALKYIKEAGEALAYIHDHKLNHLDIKPSNIIVRDKDDQALILDFGTSKQYDAISGSQTSTTPVGISHGYAPIEQYKEGGVREFSPQTDIYALGATLFKLVTGVTPPQAGDIINDGFPEWKVQLSDKTKKAIEKAMEIRKSNRPQTVREFLEMLPLSGQETEEETTVLFGDANTEKLTHDLNAAKKDIATLTARYEADMNVLKYEKSKAEDQMEAAKQKLAEAEKKCAEAEAELQTTATSVTNLQAEKDELSKKLTEAESNVKKSGKVVYWVIIALLLGSLLMAIGQCNSHRIDAESYSNEYDQLQLEQEQLKNTLQKQCPFVITKVEMANTTKSGDIVSDYGVRIMSDKTLYLTPRITYTSFVSESKTLKIKLYNDGILSTGDNSPAGFSYTCDNYFIEGESSDVLTGWGTETEGNWDSGKYRIEIWDDSKCLAAKDFRIFDE